MQRAVQPGDRMRASVHGFDLSSGSCFFSGARLRSPARFVVKSSRVSRSHDTVPQAIFGRKKVPQDTLPSKDGTQKLSKGLGGLFGGKKEEDSQGTQPAKKRSAPLQPRSKPAATQPKKPAGTQKLSFNINRGRRDNKTVFVAGGTGRLGARIIRELVNKGFNVRAGTRNVDRAQSYVDTAAAFGILPQNASRKIKIIPMDLQDEQSVAAAIGNAGKVVQAIGASEGEVLKLLTGAAAREVDGDGAINIVNAAKSVGVTQYLMVTSMGTGKFGWPAGALQLFGGILSQKRRAEKALEESGIAYTIVRPGGMERPPDSYKNTHNVTLAKRDTWFGGQVSRLQVAELIAAAAANPDLAENKVLEVQAQTEAPKLPLEDLIADQPDERADPAEQPARQPQLQPKQQQKPQQKPQQAAAKAVQPVAQAAEKVQEAVQEAAPQQQKRGGFFSGFGKQKPAEGPQEATPETASVPSTPTPAGSQQLGAARGKAESDVRAASDEKAKAEAAEKASFREKSEKKAAELAERREKAAQKQRDAETRAVRIAQEEQDQAAKAKEEARAKSRSAAAPAASPAPAAKPAAKPAEKPAAAAPQPKPAAKPATATTSNGKQAEGKAAPSANGKPTAVKAAPAAAAAAGNGKPRFAQGESTPEDIKQRKGEVQSWIKDWRSRT